MTPCFMLLDIKFSISQKNSNTYSNKHLIKKFIRKKWILDKAMLTISCLFLFGAVFVDTTLCDKVSQ